jgi:hypothetical protein
MHNAPPVVFPVGFFVGDAWPSVALAMLSWGALVFWLVQVPAEPALLAIAGLSWGLAALLALWWHRREWRGAGQLVWNGQAWHWTDLHGHEHAVAVRSQIDAGHRILLSLHAPSTAHGFSRVRLARWAWARESSMPSHWHGFRCAVYSRPLDVA